MYHSSVSRGLCSKGCVRCAVLFLYNIHANASIHYYMFKLFVFNILSIRNAISGFSTTSIFLDIPSSFPWQYKSGLYGSILWVVYRNFWALFSARNFFTLFLVFSRIVFVIAQEMAVWFIVLISYPGETRTTKSPVIVTLLSSLSSLLIFLLKDI